MSLDPGNDFVPDTWYGTPVFSVVGRELLNCSQQNEQFEKRTRYFNYLPQTVTVIERNGLRVPFPPLTDASRSEFVIQTDWWVHRSAQSRFMQLIKATSGPGQRSVTALRECLMRHKPEPHEQWITFRCELLMTQEALKNHRGEIYDHEHDIVISTFSGINAGPHPYSESGRILTELQSRTEAAIEDAYFESIRIVDNTGTQGDRYINRNGQVIRIRSARDPTWQNGIWVIRPQPHTHSRQRERMVWQRFAFEEAEAALELYKSYADAQNYGDSETKRKKERADEEAELALRKYELKEQTLRHQEKQQQWEREKAEFEQEMQRRQRDFEEEMRQSKREAERDKFYYEKQLLEAKQRKDMNDWLKQLPAILSAVALAWLTYKTARLQAK